MTSLLQRKYPLETSLKPQSSNYYNCHSRCHICSGVQLKILVWYEYQQVEDSGFSILQLQKSQSSHIYQQHIETVSFPVPSTILAPSVSVHQKLCGILATSYISRRTTINGSNPCQCLYSLPDHGFMSAAACAKGSKVSLFLRLQD